MNTTLTLRKLWSTSSNGEEWSRRWKMWVRRVSCVDHASKQARQVEWENSREQTEDLVFTDSFALQSQRFTETWDQNEHEDSETSSVLEVTVPNAPRPNRIHNPPITPLRREPAILKGPKGTGNKRDPLACILAVLEDLKAGNGRL